MIHIRDPKESIKIFNALASPIRLKIIEMLKNGNQMNINEMAQKLELTNSAMTMHIQKLVDSGIIRIQFSPCSHGTQKICSLMEDKMLIDFVDKMSGEAFYETELDVGLFSEHSINPTCGYATNKGFVAEFDNPQVFSDPVRFQSNIVWVTDGFITYRFPNKLLAHQIPNDLQFSFELSGEAPGAVELFPSDIHFIINDIDVGSYICPGECFDRKGRYTPDWWNSNFGQYGKLRILSINHEGTYLDGLFIGSTTIDGINIEKNNNISLSFKCQTSSKYKGGLTLFGTGFGDYNQGICSKLFYSEKK